MKIVWILLENLENNLESLDSKFFINFNLRLNCSLFIENLFQIYFFRRRKGTKIFLVAFYECDDDYELDNTRPDRVYCSDEQWVGDEPKCMQIHDDEGEEENTEEEGELVTTNGDNMLMM